MRLSTNFTLAEFTKSQTATRKGLDNTPGDEHLENAKKLLIGIGFDVKTVNRPGLGHGIDPDGISAGMEFVKNIVKF